MLLWVDLLLILLDVASKLRLVPQFCERDPGTFFPSLFEWVAVSSVSGQTLITHYFYNAC